jgi:hypothetical protein
MGYISPKIFRTIPGSDLPGYAVPRDYRRRCISFVPVRTVSPSHERAAVPYEGTLTLNLLMSCIYGAPCKARNFNVVYVWTYVWQR